eukprot:9034671-Ditylum_brightwellii.AAC.1
MHQAARARVAKRMENQDSDNTKTESFARSDDTTKSTNISVSMQSSTCHSSSYGFTSDEIEAGTFESTGEDSSNDW